MKKQVEIITRRVVEIDIPDEILSERSVELFSEHMYEIESVNEIFTYAAHNVNIGAEGYSVDFIGLLGEKGLTYCGNEADTKFKIIDEHSEYEVLN